MHYSQHSVGSLERPALQYDAGFDQGLKGRPQQRANGYPWLYGWRDGFRLWELCQGLRGGRR